LVDLYLLLLLVYFQFDLICFLLEKIYAFAFDSCDVVFQLILYNFVQKTILGDLYLFSGLSLRGLATEDLSIFDLLNVLNYDPHTHYIMLHIYL
jgi:hypothetical protein